MKKIDFAKKLISENRHLFKCPVCQKEMNIVDSPTLMCPNKHCFDLSSKGYINMLLKANKTKYDRLMLESRNVISKSGFFGPMLKQICNFIFEELLVSGIKHGYILDAGCGEGSHLSWILTELKSRSSAKLQGVGIDISKEGIRIAARDYMNIIWCVADLSRLPFNDKQFDVILNILSPASYTEFNRVLKDNGVLIKVVPEKEYLIQLRNVFYDRSYSNEKVVRLFTESFHLLKDERVTYEVDLDETNINHLLNMTPLTWNIDKEKIKEALKMRMSKITADFRIIYGGKF